MNAKTLAIISFALLFAAPFAALAGHHYHCGYGMFSSWDMSEMDNDGDRNLTFEEYSQRMTEKLRAGFDMIDTNKDTVIDEDEWEAIRDAHGMGADKE